MWVHQEVILHICICSNHSGKIKTDFPRQHKFDEHVNDHQVEFARNVAERMGTIIPVEDIGKLEEIIMDYDQIAAGIQDSRYEISL